MPKSDGKGPPVGYCSPPIETRFKTGMSGNPKGRPRKPAGERDELAQLLHGVNKVSVAGKAMEVRRIDLLLQSMKRKALDGDYKAAVDLLQLHRREQRRRALPLQRLNFPSVLIVPYSPAQIVSWSELFGDDASAGSVPGHRKGHRIGRPEWLMEQHSAQGKRCGDQPTSDRDKATARLFRNRVKVLQGGVETKVPLSRALYSKLADAAQNSSAAWKALSKMEEETQMRLNDEAADAEEQDHGVLIVPQSPDTIEEWVRVFGHLASGAYAKEQRQEYERVHGPS